MTTTRDRVAERAAKGITTRSGRVLRGPAASKTTKTTKAAKATQAKVKAAKAQAAKARAAKAAKAAGRLAPGTPNREQELPVKLMAPTTLTMYVGTRLTELYWGSRSPRSQAVLSPPEHRVKAHRVSFDEKCRTYKNGTSDGLSKSYLDGEFDNPTRASYALLATYNDPATRKSEVAGYIKGAVYSSYAPIGATKIFLIDIICTQGARVVKGVGNLLMQTLERIAMDAGAKMIVLYSVKDANTYTFYKNLGFVRSSDACAGTDTAQNKDAKRWYAELKRNSTGRPLYDWPNTGTTKPPEKNVAADDLYLTAMNGKFYRNPKTTNGILNRWNDYVLMTKCIRGGGGPGNGSVIWNGPNGKAEFAPFVEGLNRPLGTWAGKPWARSA